MNTHDCRRGRSVASLPHADGQATPAPSASSFDGPPDNVVAISQAATELLYALDLGDRMAGTALWFNDVLPVYRDVDATVERLSDDAPSFEIVVARRPASIRPCSNG